MSMTNGLLLLIALIVWSWDIDRQQRGPNDLSANAERLLTFAAVGGFYAMGWLTP